MNSISKKELVASANQSRPHKPLMLILRLTLPKAWALDQDQIKIANPKNRIVVKSGSPVTPYSHLEGILTQVRTQKTRVILPEVGWAFSAASCDSKFGTFHSKQFDSHAIEHLLELAG